MEPLIGVIIVIALSFFALMIVFRTARKFFRILFAINILLMVIIAILGVFIWQDAMSLKKRFPTDPKLLILKDGDQVVSAVRLRSLSQAPEYISQEQLANYDEMIKSNNLIPIAKENYKLFIVPLQSLRPFDDIDVGVGTLSENDTLALLEDQDAVAYLAAFALRNRTSSQEAIQSVEDNLHASYGSSAELKSRIFGLLLSDAMKRDSLFIIRKFKDNEISIFPQTIVFTFIRFVPQSVVDLVVGA